MGTDPHYIQFQLSMAVQKFSDTATPHVILHTNVFNMVHTLRYTDF